MFCFLAFRCDSLLTRSPIHCHQPGSDPTLCWVPYHTSAREIVLYDQLPGAAVSTDDGVWGMQHKTGHLCLCRLSSRLVCFSEPCSIRVYLLGEGVCSCKHTMLTFPQFGPACRTYYKTKQSVYMRMLISPNSSWILNPVPADSWTLLGSDRNGSRSLPSFQFFGWKMNFNDVYVPAERVTTCMKKRRERRWREGWRSVESGKKGWTEGSESVDGEMILFFSSSSSFTCSTLFPASFLCFSTNGVL